MSLPTLIRIALGSRSVNQHRLPGCVACAVSGNVDTAERGRGRLSSRHRPHLRARHTAGIGLARAGTHKGDDGLQPGS